MDKVMKEVLPKRVKLKWGQFEKIDQPLHGKALGMVEGRYRPSILKGVWGENPNMSKLRRDGRREDANRPLCGWHDDKDHFSKCSVIKATDEYGQI